MLGGCGYIDPLHRNPGAHGRSSRLVDGRQRGHSVFDVFGDLSEEPWAVEDDRGPAAVEQSGDQGRRRFGRQDPVGLVPLQHVLEGGDILRVVHHRLRPRFEGAPTEAVHERRVAVPVRVGIGEAEPPRRHIGPFLCEGEQFARCLRRLLDHGLVVDHGDVLVVEGQAVHGVVEGHGLHGEVDESIPHLVLQEKVEGLHRVRGLDPAPQPILGEYEHIRPFASRHSGRDLVGVGIVRHGERLYRDAPARGLYVVSGHHLFEGGLLLASVRVPDHELGLGRSGLRESQDRTNTKSGYCENKPVSISIICCCHIHFLLVWPSRNQ